MRTIKIIIDGPKMYVEADGFTDNTCKTTIDELLSSLAVVKTEEQAKVVAHDMKVPVGVKV